MLLPYPITISRHRISKNMRKLLKTSLRLLNDARNMLKSCESKGSLDFAFSRLIVAYFFRRAVEMFESYLILIKHKRVIDSLILIRSYCELGISLGWIFTDDIDKDEKEVKALKYMLNGDKAQLKIINANLNDFKQLDKHIVAKRDELKVKTEEFEETLKEKYGVEDWKLPDIEERAKKSGFQVVKDMYNQVYRYTSNIEHHNMFFGQDYVDMDSCKPFECLDKFEKLPHMKPAVNLFLFRAVFIEVLGAFNDEFSLGYEQKLMKMRENHEEEYDLIRNA